MSIFSRLLQSMSYGTALIASMGCASAPWRIRYGVPWLVVVALLVALTTSARAQSTAEHDVRVQIPNYVGIKILDATGSRTSMSGVGFDYAADPATFFAADLTGGTIRPTDVMRFSDIQIRAGWLWSVYVRATPITYVGPRGGAGLGLGDIEVHRGVASGLSPGVGGFTVMNTTWALGTDYKRIARGLGSTRGWKSLGFNGQDYLVRINGDEDPGEYRTRVTYLLASL